MENLILFGSYFSGLILVLIFSIKEFNAPKYNYHDNESEGDLIDESPYARLAQPTLPKYMADSSRYTVFMVAFIAFAAGLFFFLTYVLLIIPQVSSFLGTNNKAWAAILSALILVGIVKSDDFMPKKIQFFIKWPKTLLFVMIKGWMHSFAYIPGLSCDVFNTLCYEDIDLDSQVVKNNLDEIIKKKYHSDFDVKEYIERNDFKSIGNPTNMIDRWSRLSYFIFIVDKWSDDSKFKNQVRERSLGWGALKEAYISLVETMVKFRDKNIDMSQDEEDALSKQIDHLLANCYRLISCVVIMTANPSEDPLSYVNEIGLKVHPSGQIFTRRGEMFRIIFALVPTIIIIAVLYALFEPGTGIEKTIHDIIIYVVSAGIIMIFPIILVFALKRQLAISKSWRVVTPENPYQSFFHMPLGKYAMISVLAWAISLILMMVFMSDKGLMASNTMAWKSASIFCFISAITAFITCYRTDIPPRVYKRKVNFLMVIVGLSILHGTLTALTVWVGLVMSGLDYGDYLWQYPLLGFSISLAIGFTLFYGKHKVENRSTSSRISCNEPVMVVQGDYQFPAIMLNKSSKGVMLMLNQARSMIQDNKTIEIIFGDGLKKIGSIVRMDMKQLNIAYQ